jgi:hypothetical protein
MQMSNYDKVPEVISKKIIAERAGKVRGSGEEE